MSPYFTTLKYHLRRIYTYQLCIYVLLRVLIIKISKFFACRILEVQRCFKYFQNATQCINSLHLKGCKMGRFSFLLSIFAALTTTTTTARATTTIASILIRAN